MPAGGREKMRYIVNSREMNLYDSRTIEEFHMPQAVLMERRRFPLWRHCAGKNGIRQEHSLSAAAATTAGTAMRSLECSCRRETPSMYWKRRTQEKRPSAISSRRRSFLRTAVRSSRNFRREVLHARDRRGIRRGIIAQCGGRIRIVNRPDECHGRGEGGG